MADRPCLREEFNFLLRGIRGFKHRSDMDYIERKRKKE